MAYRPCIGVEVHAQLLTDSKMFCGCSTQFGNTANSQCCPVCSGIPGSLPVINRKAVEFVLRTGTALGCRPAPRCRFARKNYFYPDLAKNYQISQYEEPLTAGGRMTLEVDGEAVDIRIRRVHLEEDTGKNFHLPDGTSLVEYNRCGVPLMEVVTEPDFTSAEQVREYLNELRAIFRYLGVSSAAMEEGAMRAEPSVNLVDPLTGDATPRVEIKNLASVRAVYDAVKYELWRQQQALDAEEPMTQQTRRWSVERQETQVMRDKESSEDYMYFPEPDLVPMEVNEAWAARVAAELPELPRARRARFVTEYGLPAYDAEVLTAQRELADYFEAVARTAGDAKAASNWVMGDLTRLLNETAQAVAASPVSADQLAELVRMIGEGRLTSKLAKDVFEEMFRTGGSAPDIMAAQGLGVVNDAGELEPIIAAVLSENAEAVASYRSGRKQAKGVLVGAVMKATHGQADPKLVNQLLEKALG